jgi:hypothetical protein
VYRLAGMTCRRSQTLLIVAGLGVATGCGDGPAAPLPVEPLPIVLASDTITLTARGATAAVMATVGGVSVTVTLGAVRDESRWNSELAVASHAGNVVTATGAGSVGFAVTATGGIPTEVFVRVAPDRPYLATIPPNSTVGPDAPLVLHGFGLEAVEPAAFALGDDHPTIAALDSARIELRFPMQSGSACGGGQMPLTVDTVGLDYTGPVVPVYRMHEDDHRLSIGATLTLTAADVDCLRLGAGEYMAVFYDARLIYPKQPHPYVKDGDFSVTVSDVSAGTVPTDIRAVHGWAVVDQVHSHGDWVSTDQVEADWRLRTEPAAVGDTLNYRSLSEFPDGVVVVAVVDGYQVITTPIDSVVPVATLEGMVALTEYFNARHRPWLEDLYGVTPGGANGQYLVNIIPMHTAAVSGYANPYAQTLRVGIGAWDQVDGIYQLFAHELAHSYHGSYQIAQGTTYDPHRIPPATMYVGRELWQVEGLAEHIGFRMAAEFGGVELGANHTLSQVGPLISSILFFDGRIERGYRPAGAKLWDLAGRLAAATGLAWEEAHDSVSLAVAHNRWGCLVPQSPQNPGDCDIHDGLYDMMQRKMPGGWDPVDAILLFALSQAADDLTDNPEIQNPHIRSAQPHGTMSRHSDWRAVAYEGNAQVFTLETGSVGAVRLAFPHPGAFRLESDVDPVRWKLIRIE